MKLIQNAILLGMVALCASCNSRPETDLAFYVQQSDIVVHGKVRDMNSLNKDNVNRYWGATVEPIEYLKGTSRSDVLRVNLCDFGRKTRIFPMLEDQVSGIETNQEAIFFLTKRGGFKDLDTGIRTTYWKLILPLEWKSRVKQETD